MGNNFAAPGSPQARMQRQLPVLPISQPQRPNRSPSPPPAHQILTCEICTEPIRSPTQIFKATNPNCGRHPFCNDCIVKHVQAKLEDNISQIPCPALECSELLDPHDCRGLVGPRMFVRWCDSLCEFAVKDVSKSYCPNRECSALILDECREGSDREPWKATCPGCKLPFCFLCKLPWHAGFRCGQLKDEIDRAFGVFAERNMWMSCPHCHHFVEKVEGCFIVACRCGTLFCYRCGNRSHHQHFCGDCDGPWKERCQRICERWVLVAIACFVFWFYYMIIFFHVYRTSN